jgi:periplasmic divalent cation tolerance protein
MAHQMVERRLAACAQVVGPVESVYWWKAGVESAKEWQVWFKTLDIHWTALEAAIKGMHHYECPEILAFLASEVTPGYFNWLKAELP